MAPWQRWLLPGIIVAFFVALFALPRGAVAGMPLTYTQFVADVGAGTVRAVTIGPAGQVTGSLTSGQPFTTTIPVALGSNSLAGDLAAHHVQVTATAAAATSSSLASVLTGLLPLLLIGGLIYFVIRSARRPAGDRVHRRDQRPRRPPRCRPGSIAAMLGAGLARRRPSAGSAGHAIRAARSCPLALR
jgi:ATP-dependent Zn protease